MSATARTTWRALLEHYLTHEGERRTLAAAGHARAQGFGFETLWREALGRLEEEWPDVREAAGRRPRLEGDAALLARTWQALSRAGPADPDLAAGLDAALAARPREAALHHARGLVAGLVAGGGPGRARRRRTARRAARGFRKALQCDPDDAVAGVNLIEALASLGRKDLAVEGRGGRWRCWRGAAASGRARGTRAGSRRGSTPSASSGSGPPGPAPAGPTPRRRPNPTSCAGGCTRSWPI